MAATFVESHDIHSVFVPVDMSTAANTGDWISLKHYDSAVFVLFGAAGTAGQDPVFTLSQASDNAGTGSKALNFLEVQEKVGTLASVTDWTKVTQAAANTYTNTVSAEAQKFIMVEIEADMLDVDNGFTHVQLSIPDVGAAAQIGCAFCILHRPRYGGASIENSLA